MISPICISTFVHILSLLNIKVSTFLSVICFIIPLKSDAECSPLPFLMEYNVLQSVLNLRIMRKVFSMHRATLQLLPSPHVRKPLSCYSEHGVTISIKSWELLASCGAKLP